MRIVDMVIEAAKMPKKADIQKKTGDCEDTTVKETITKETTAKERWYWTCSYIRIWVELQNEAEM